MIGRTRWHFPEVDSTQTVAFRLAEQGAAHGTVVRADFQTAGRGRQGRKWISDRSSALMFSVILRTHESVDRIGHFSLVLADAVAEVVRNSIDSPVHVKWPNDILIDGKKSVGILVQTRTGSETVIVAGIGINVAAMASDQLPDATSLNANAKSPVDPDSLFETILKRIEAGWNTLDASLDSETLDRLNEHLWLKGCGITLLDGDREIRGRVLEVASNGGLRMEIAGKEQIVMVGEITRGPRPIDDGIVNR